MEQARVISPVIGGRQVKAAAANVGDVPPPSGKVGDKPATQHAGQIKGGMMHGKVLDPAQKRVMAQRAAARSMGI